MKSPNYRKKSKKHIDKSIAIIGHMGSGKTLIGKLIAKELNYRFFDSDKIIEKNTQKSIKNIFPGCNLPLVTTFSGSTGKTPTSEAIMTLSSSVK